ncbi:MAG: putative Ig domain-containing protein, partial [Candidatus Zixiibacteriota bacterium]
APVITTTAPTAGQVGVAYSYDVDATGYPAPTFALTTAPAGMTIDAGTGLISWTPTVDGDFNVTVEASNSEGSDAQSFVITVIPALAAPVITTTAPTAGQVGVAYSYDVDATGYPAPTFVLTTAPAGMAIDGGTGLISWTPTTPGEYTVCVEACNSEGCDVQCYTITVVEILPPTVYHLPDPIFLKELGDKVIWFYIENEETEKVDLSTVRIHDKVPPYLDGYPIVENGVIITNCYAMRFLSAYRPIQDAVHSTFTVTYMKDGEPVTLTGDANVEIYPGDVNLDGYVNQDDVDILVEYLWKGGQKPLFEERLDVNNDGQVDSNDLAMLNSLLGQ